MIEAPDLGFILVVMQALDVYIFGTMYIPCARERVEVVGHEGVFLVITVDWARQVADLIPLAGGLFGLEGVSFAKLRPFAKEVPRDVF